MSGTITRIGAIGAGALLAIGLLAASPAGAANGERNGKGPAGAANGERNGKGHAKGHEKGHRPGEATSAGHGQHAACFDMDGKTQGRSQSDPDGMENGGFDKPGCTGGFDSDRDGNNGCGNDADREDDNNGHCGKKAASVDPTDDSDVDGAGCGIGSKGSAGCDSDADLGAAAAAGGTSAGTVVDGAVVAGSTATATDASGADTAAGATVAGTVDAAGATTEPGTQVLGESIERPSALARTGVGVGGLALLGGLLCGAGRISALARRFARIG